MCILVCVCVCKRGKKLSGRLAETNTMTMWCTAVISLWNTGREANQGSFIIRCSSWSTTYCGHTWRHNCVQAGLVCKELLASVATQLAHSTVNLISDLAVLSQQNKAQRRKHSIYYLFLPKQKPLTWCCLLQIAWVPVWLKAPTRSGAPEWGQALAS